MNERDLVLSGADSATQLIKTNLLLDDLVHLHHVVAAVQGQTAPSVEEAADTILDILKNGKSYELAGIKDVPRPFLKSSGRVLAKEGDNYKELSDQEAKDIIIKRLTEEAKQDNLEDLKVLPYSHYKERSERDIEDGPSIVPEAKDAILMRCSDPDDRLFEQQGGNKVVFNLASQLVTTLTTSSETRVKAALSIMDELDDADIPLPDDAKDNKPPSSKKPRFLVRQIESDGETLTWKMLSAFDAAIFAVTFVFEVFLEKELYLGPSKNDETATADLVPPSKNPVDDPTDHDVLFGRGGMTNSHPGNRRFRDIIALHRPDYIRAIKMDKPAVAKKIVKAIRCGTPAGRFLKKGEDGAWYDVGDRTAAEKTSQGLRERSNAEKRQRSELRRALRIRKEDMEEDDNPSKKAKADELNTAVSLSNTLNYVGTSLAVPLSLSMAQVVPNSKKKLEKRIKSGVPELDTEGLPPNAVDEDGNILVTDYDILCGRGGLTNHHKGNKRFRDIVALHRPDYVRAPKIQKPSVARVIVRAIRNGDPPGRFLRKDEKTGKWVDIGDKKAAEKTSQALREKSNEERDTLRRVDPASMGVLLPNPASYLAATTATVIGNILAAGTAPPPAADESKELKDKKTEESKEEEDDDNDDKKPAASEETAEQKEEEAAKAIHTEVV